MKLIYCGLFFKNPFEVIEKSKIAPSLATHKFNSNFMLGLHECLGDDLVVINTEDYASYPHSRFFVVKNEKYIKNSINIETIGKLNISGLKYLFEYKNYIKTIKEHISNNPNEEICILCYGRYFPNVLAVNAIKREYPQVKTCMILADLSGSAATKTDNYGVIRELFSGKLVSMALEKSKKFDSFVLVSKHMESYLQIEDKPNVIIEGMVNSNVVVKCGQAVDNVVLYSGILSKQYGVDTLINAMKLLPSNVELHLYGDGPLKNEIKRLNDKRIKFFGYIVNEELLVREAEATVLINPRPNIEDFTRYSMPSKNLEYLFCARPVVCYKLDGITDEYDEYYNYVAGNDASDIADAIRKILDMSPEEQEKEGLRNKEFIINNKSNLQQAKKIVEMFNKL